MVIRFKKGKNRPKHKPDTLTCIRDDGSVTWTHLHRGFVQHDFAHYVVERTLSTHRSLSTARQFLPRHLLRAPESDRVSDSGSDEGQ